MICIENLNDLFSTGWGNTNMTNKDKRMKVYLVWVADELGKELIEIYDSAEKALKKQRELQKECNDNSYSAWSMITEREVK